MNICIQLSNGRTSGKLTQRDKFKEKKKLIDLDFQIIKDISNGTKHKEITRYEPKLKTTKKHNGAFSNAFSRGFDISVLLVELRDGTELYFEDIADRIYAFWVDFFETQAK